MISYQSVSHYADTNSTTGSVSMSGTTSGTAGGSFTGTTIELQSWTNAPGGLFQLVSAGTTALQQSTNLFSTTESVQRGWSTAQLGSSSSFFYSGGTTNGTGTAGSSNGATTFSTERSYAGTRLTDRFTTLSDNGSSHTSSTTFSTSLPTTVSTYSATATTYLSSTVASTAVSVVPSIVTSYAESDDEGNQTTVYTFEDPFLFYVPTTIPITTLETTATASYTFISLTTGAVDSADLTIFPANLLTNTIVIPQDHYFSNDNGVVWVPKLRSDTTAASATLDLTGRLTDLADSFTDEFTLYASDWMRSSTISFQTFTALTARPTTRETFAFTSISYTYLDTAWSQVTTYLEGTTAFQGNLATETLAGLTNYSTLIPTASTWTNLGPPWSQSVSSSTTRTHRISTTSSATIVPLFSTATTTTVTSVSTTATEGVALAGAATFGVTMSTTFTARSYVSSTVVTTFGSFIDDALNADIGFLPPGSRTSEVAVSTLAVTTVTGWTENTSTTLPFFGAIVFFSGGVGAVEATVLSSYPDRFQSWANVPHTYYVPTNAQGFGLMGTAGEPSEVYRSVTADLGAFPGVSFNIAPFCSLVARAGVSALITRPGTFDLPCASTASSDVRAAATASFVTDSAGDGNVTGLQATLAVTLGTFAWDESNSGTTTGMVVFGFAGNSGVVAMSGHSIDATERRGHGGRQYVTAANITRAAGVGRRRGTVIEEGGGSSSYVTHRTVFETSALPSSQIIVESVDRIWTVSPTAAIVALSFDEFPTSWSDMTYPLQSAVS